ncbi:MAG: TolC family protein [Proteobacteria bacterium]|nr:TolC family protein [Pseudomonadota bacterium]
MCFNFSHFTYLVNILLYSIPFAILVGLSSSLYATTAKTLYANEEVKKAEVNLSKAIKNPEYMLNNWLELPLAPPSNGNKSLKLSLREAILLALRYNPNIQNAELDRIIQRYQLRLAHNEFELQYALGGAAAVERSRFSGVGSASNKSFLATPEMNLRTKLGTQMGLNIANNVSNYSSYTPVLNFSINQPLLRGFGKAVNEARLLDAIDNEWLNKLNLQQSVMDQVTEVINAYRALILSGNNLQTQQLQLVEAQKTYESNEKRIKAGQLEPTGNIQPSYQIESLSLMVEQAQFDFESAALQLIQTIGLDPKMHLAVPSDVEMGEIVVPRLQESLDWAFQHNVQYLAQKMLLRADERAYQVAKNEQLWQLDVGANVQSGMVNDLSARRGFASIYNGQNLNETARLTLTIPLHDLSRRSQLINAKVRLEKDKLNLINLKRSLETTITNIINSIGSLAKRYRLAEKQVSLAEKAYFLEKKKQEAGIASSLDVNNTQNQLIQAKVGLIGAKIAYLNQISALERLLGKTLERWQIKLRYGE